MSIRNLGGVFGRNPQFGDVSALKLNVDNIQVDGNTISATDTNGSLTLAANGTGLVTTASVLRTTSVLSLFSGRDWRLSSTSSIFTIRDSSAALDRATCGLTGLWRFHAYGAGTATFDASGNISSVSDERLKIKDGVPEDPISMVMALQPGYYKWKLPENEVDGDGNAIENPLKDRRELGHYAQNVHAAIGEEAAPTPNGDKPMGYYDRSVAAVHTLAIQNHELRIAELEATIAQLSAKLATLAN